MTAGEWRRFVLEGTRTAKLATVALDGSPRVVPVWFVLDDDDTFVMTVSGGSAKAKAMRRDPRVSLLVDDERPPFSFVSVRGTATLSDDLDTLRRWATRIGGRYMGAERAEEFGRRNAVPGELLVRLAPERVVAHADVAG
jgi:PPOX class probable F420-dependent enzyme